MNEGMNRTPVTRHFFDGPVLEPAPGIPGRGPVRDSYEGHLDPGLTEGEAYAGEIAPRSCAFRGRPTRGSGLSGRPAHRHVRSTNGMSSRSA
ncbi:DNA-3-methyladenine glycosylase [Streptomyces sp. HB132]|uniref:DNA-3-methyladenine glycosylase n=1 Tax=Streptomyces sp. HB132 TaxID=767388 RepID=UPI00195F37AD|nr:DNA-3-methyladenine glycosylase [Streptomyces sp. HB132]MBM7438149.1 3-methyladenine DNA glycosylase Mpg [Streptomyces sp. HB132]